MPVDSVQFPTHSVTTPTVTCCSTTCPEAGRCAGGGAVRPAHTSGLDILTHTVTAPIHCHLLSYTLPPPRRGAVLEAVAYAQSRLARLRCPTLHHLDGALRDVVALIAYEKPEVSRCGLLPAGAWQLAHDILLLGLNRHKNMPWPWWCMASTSAVLLPERCPALCRSRLPTALQ